MKSSVFNVINYNPNGRFFEPYDIMPYLRACYSDRVKKSKRKKPKLMSDKDYLKYYKIPETFDEFKNFVEVESFYQYWSRCEYEIILSDWPSQGIEAKWDVYRQIMMNIDVVTDLLMKDVAKPQKTKKR